jgi:lipopolysaccharide biosynthesis glycosyltransferase
MNCVFICVFNNPDYLNLLFLLVRSIQLYGELGEETDILIYTSTVFMNRIKGSRFYRPNIKFETNDEFGSLYKACMARLDLFDLASTKQYNKILYLDTDILVKKKLGHVFNLVEEDKLYVLKEGSITSDTNFWGKSLFGNEVHRYRDKSAFTSGILLFNNCETMKTLFENIKKDIQRRPELCTFYDQPFIVYNAFKYNLYENTKLTKSFAVNNSQDVNSIYTIHHFPGGVGCYEVKIERMTKFFNNLIKKPR